MITSYREAEKCTMECPDFRPKAVRQTKYACAIARRPHYGVFINELDFKEGDVIYNLWKTEDKSIWLVCHALPQYFISYKCYLGLLCGYLPGNCQ